VGSQVASGLNLVHFNPILVRFKLAASLPPDDELHNFNPILVRFKPRDHSDPPGVHSPFQSYFSPIQTPLRWPTWPGPLKFQSYFSPIQTHGHGHR